MPSSMQTPSTLSENLDSDFRAKITMPLSIAMVIILTPVTINNFVQGRHFFGLLSLVIVLASAGNTWTIWQGRYSPLVTLVGVIPAAMIGLGLALLQHGMIGILWCYPMIALIYFTLGERQAWIVNIILLGFVFPMAWTLFELVLVIRVVVTLSIVSVFSAVFVRIISRQRDMLKTFAITDALTGLSNRVLLNPTLERAWQQSRRSHLPVTLVSMDLDHFKKINDTFGHQAGDTVLRQVGSLLINRTRRADAAFRVGGEEFLLLLYGTDNNQALHFAESLRLAVTAAESLADHRVTVSIGVATLAPQEGWESWLERVDEGLYMAKSLGRNRVVNMSRSDSEDTSDASSDTQFRDSHP